eukprot:181793-Rhodomonas_salina.4
MHCARSITCVRDETAQQELRKVRRDIRHRVTPMKSHEASQQQDRRFHHQAQTAMRVRGVEEGSATRFMMRRRVSAARCSFTGAPAHNTDTPCQISMSDLPMSDLHVLQHCTSHERELQHMIRHAHIPCQIFNTFSHTPPPPPSWQV